MSKIDTTVGQLDDMIERGDLRLPEMQRRYVWTSTRVRDFSRDISSAVLRRRKELAEKFDSKRLRAPIVVLD